MQQVRAGNRIGADTLWLFTPDRYSLFRCFLASNSTEVVRRLGQTADGRPVQHLEFVRSGQPLVLVCCAFCLFGVLDLL